MKSLKKILFVFALGVAFSSLGQENSVGINTTNPNDNAVLDLVSPDDENMGFLMPRLSTIRRELMGQDGNLTNADNGLMVYDSDEGAFYYWKNGEWIKGLGIFSDAQVFGDLTGEFPNLFLKLSADKSKREVELDSFPREVLFELLQNADDAGASEVTFSLCLGVNFSLPAVPSIS